MVLRLGELAWIKGRRRNVVRPSNNRHHLIGFFTGDSNWALYASEFDGEDIFFGLVSENGF